MSRILKMGTMAALKSLEDAGCEKPDAIITGTGLGCLTDSEKFLVSLIKNEEKFLNPAPFIHSTHNTISAQIALFLKCTHYNQTYSQGALSFESALLDASMLLDEHSELSVLVGGVDEATDRHQTISKRCGQTKRKGGNSSELLPANCKGSMPGEGAAFFLLSNRKSKNSYAMLKDQVIVCDGDFDFESQLTELLNQHQLTTGDLDLCLLGKNGDKQNDSFYDGLETGVLKNHYCGYFKHLCGEYDTAAAFALWLAAQGLKHQFFAKSLIQTNADLSAIKHVLIYNHIHTRQHSLLLLSAC